MARFELSFETSFGLKTVVLLVTTGCGNHLTCGMPQVVYLWLAENTSFVIQVCILVSVPRLDEVLSRRSGNLITARLLSQLERPGYFGF